MNNKIYFISMKVYGRKDSKFNSDQRAIIKFSRPLQHGTPVMYEANNTKVFGEVIDCIETENGSELHRALEGLNGEEVYVHVPPGRGIKNVWRRVMRHIRKHY